VNVSVPEGEWLMMTSRPARWALTIAALFTVTAVAFLPILFGLAKTPLHDGSDVPGGLLLAVSFVASVGIGVLAAWFVHRLLRPGSASARTR
jgi:hypothetical protein